MSASPLKVSKLNHDDLLVDDIIHHFNGIAKTPLHKEAFNLSPEEKIEIITEHFREILHTLGMDLNDESIKDTPRRVAKMYVNETFKGLIPENEPAVTQFANDYRYSQMLVERNITVFSTCEHHLVPIHGKAHVAYFSSGEVIGLSKLNRLVDFYSRRPQVQERLTIQIAEALKKALNTNDVAVVIDAHHMCVASRGIRDVNSSTVTAEYSGKFLNPETRKEFLEFIRG